MVFNFSHRPRPEPRPSLSWPKPMSTAQASVLEGRGHEKPSFTDSFRAKPSRHNTIGICKFATKYLLNPYGIYTSMVSTTLLPDIYGSL